MLGALANLGSAPHAAELARLLSGPGVREAAMETTFVRRDSPTANTINTALRRVASGRGNEWEPRVYASIALAQRGDAAAVATLVAELNGTSRDARDAIVNAVGGAYNTPTAGHFTTAGQAIVADARLIPALLAYYDAESDGGRRERALYAAASIRALAGNQATTATPATAPAAGRRRR